MNTILEIAKANLDNTAMLVGAAVIIALTNKAEDIIRQLRLLAESLSKTAIVHRKDANQSRQLASNRSTSRPSLLVLPLSSVILVALIILSAMDGHPLAGGRLLLVLGMVVLVSVSLTLWFVVPLFFTLGEVICSMRER